MKHFEPREAYEFLRKNPNAIFIDCRSEMEYLFVGHPTGAILVPWNDGPNWDVSPDFVSHVKKAASVDRPIVLICRSGNRTLDAGRALEDAGFTQVYNVLKGFEGDPCGECGNFTLVRNGTCMKCHTCGATSGCS